MNEPQKTRSALITALGWLLLAVSGYQSARALRDNFALVMMFSSPDYMLRLATATLPVDMPALAGLIVTHLRLVFFFYLVLSLTVLASSIGLLLRKAWALKVLRWLCYCGCGALLVFIIFPGLLVPEPYIYQGVSVAPAFNDAVGQFRFYARILAAALAAMLFWFARIAERPAIKNEFGL